MTLLPGIIWGWRSVRTSAPRECAQLSALVATRKRRQANSFMKGQGAKLRTQLRLDGRQADHARR